MKMRDLDTFSQVWPSTVIDAGKRTLAAVWPRAGQRVSTLADQRYFARLSRGELWRLEPAGTPWQLQCLSGTLWITQAGRGEDVIIQAGENRSFNLGGLVLVQALEPARVQASRLSRR